VATQPQQNDFPISATTSYENIAEPLTTPVIPVDTHLPDAIWQKIQNTWTDGGDGGNLRYSGGDGYSLSYSRRFDSFKSTIWSEPAYMYRKAMETELQEMLGLPEEQICKLNIDVARDTELTVYEFQDIGLSFCEGSVTDDGLKLMYLGEGF
jgi:hypothetical protein